MMRLSIKHDSTHLITTTLTPIIEHWVVTCGPHTRTHVTCGGVTTHTSHVVHGCGGDGGCHCCGCGCGGHGGGGGSMFSCVTFNVDCF